MGWDPEELARKPADLVAEYMSYLDAEAEARGILADRATKKNGRRR